MEQDGSCIQMRGYSVRHRSLNRKKKRVVLKKLFFFFETIYNFLEYLEIFQKNIFYIYEVVLSDLRDLPALISSSFMMSSNWYCMYFKGTTKLRTL